MPPRFAVTDAQIAAVIDEFYAVVQVHPGLGPVFAAHVTDWDAHKAKITAFWRNAILYERGYDGNPMQVHKAAGNVRPGMFVPWLALFDAVLQRNLPPEVAAAVVGPCPPHRARAGLWPDGAERGRLACRAALTSLTLCPAQRLSQASPASDRPRPRKLNTRVRPVRPAASIRNTLAIVSAMTVMAMRRRVVERRAMDW